MGLLKLNDDMPTDLANSLKANEDAPLVSVTENEEVATLTATIETNLRQGDIATEVEPFQVTRRRLKRRTAARRAE